MAAASVLICEDSGIYAAALRRTLEYDGDINVICVCGSAEEALAAIRTAAAGSHHDGHRTAGHGRAGGRRDSSWAPGRCRSSCCRRTWARAAHKAAAALAAGALDAVAKDDLDLSRPASMAGAAFRQRIRVISHATVLRHPRARLGRRRRRCPASRGWHRRWGSARRLAGRRSWRRYWAGCRPATRCRSSWCSTSVPGSPKASPTGWTRSPRCRSASPRTGNWPAPASGSRPRVPTWCSTRAAGCRWTGPRSWATTARPATSCSPASPRRRAGAASPSCLPGWGSDGAAGTAAVHAAGGFAITQDEASSAIYGMPKAAFERGADMALPPDQIIKTLAALRHQPLGVSG